MSSSEQGSGKQVNKIVACAVCRHQRRRCFDCPLAPYFPADQPERFASVHRLFGVNNVMKILREIDHKDWPIAMETIQYEADVTRNEPVFGCMGVIRQLQAQIEACRKEIELADQELAYLREQDRQLELQLQHPDNIAVPPPAFGYHDQKFAFGLHGDEKEAGPSNTEQSELRDWIVLCEELELDKLNSFDQTTQTVGVPKIDEASSSEADIKGKAPVCHLLPEAFDDWETEADIKGKVPICHLLPKAFDNCETEAENMGDCMD